jgi:glycosyltransferase involved in cell wall biosynthesis
VVDQEHDALVQAGHEVERFERHSDEIAQMPLRRKALVPTRVVWSSRSAHELDGAIETVRPDVVHLHNLFPLLSPSVLLSCQRHKVPCVATFHNYRAVCAGGSLFRDGAVCRDCVGHRLPIPAMLHGCYRESTLTTVPVALATVAHRRFWQSIPSAYIFISDAQRREIESAGYPLSRSFVKPHLVPPVAPRTGSQELVVYLGRLTEEKGLRVLMRAWDRYTGARTTPGLRLVIAGTGPLEEEIGVWARSRPSVSVPGLLDRTQCTELVRQARTVVVPSEWPEPFGLVVAESMAAGVMPTATAHGSFVELITDGVDGLLYPPGDVDALTVLLQKVEDAPEWADRLGKAARETYERRFEPSKNIAELERIYQFAMDSPRWLDGPDTGEIPETMNGPVRFRGGTPPSSAPVDDATEERSGSAPTSEPETPNTSPPA